MKLKDTVVFMLGCVRNPKIKGAVCPSSKYLANAMASGVNGRGIVLELGAGSGAVTRALVDRGFANNGNLISVEYDTKLATFLGKKFPAVRVVNDSAENVRKILGNDADKLVAVVSSLPFLSLPEYMAKRIISEVESIMPKGARFIQFTYNLNREPTEIGFKNMRAVGKIRVFRNIPPARIDILEKI